MPIKEILLLPNGFSAVAIKPVSIQGLKDVVSGLFPDWAECFRLRPFQFDNLCLMSSLRWHLDKAARPAGLAVVLSGNLRNETFRTQIMDRLAIHDVAGLVRYAIRQGIVPL